MATGTLADRKMAAMRRLLYATGTLSDRYFLFLKDRTAGTGTITDLELEYFISKSLNPSPLNLTINDLKEEVFAGDEGLFWDTVL